MGRSQRIRYPSHLVFFLLSALLHRKVYLELIFFSVCRSVLYAGLQAVLFPCNIAFVIQKIVTRFSLDLSKSRRKNVYTPKNARWNIISEQSDSMIQY